MRILGIESTCDETGCAIVDDGRVILSNVVASQIDLHQAFGGVVPELACRRHIEVILPVIDQAVAEAEISLDSVDAIAVAYGPGLIGALLIGLTTAKALALSLNRPLIGVNHIEAHLYAGLLAHLDSLSFPCLGVVVSGGHTCLVLVHSVGRYELIGQTVDDAIGEAFDKVAKMLGLPYPGGPAVEALARQGDASHYTFPAGKLQDRPFDLSYSGLKTAVLYTLKGVGANAKAPLQLEGEELAHVAASFQEAALCALLTRCAKAARQYHCKTVVFGGGVTNNQRLRALAAARLGSYKLCFPAPGLELDNAAMIAGLGYHRFRLEGKASPFDLQPQTRIPW